MPKASKQEWDSANGRYYDRTVGQDEEVLVKDKAQRPMAAAAGVSSGAPVMRKAKSLGDMVQAKKEHDAALAKWRAGKQAGALENKP